jgi:cytochrome c oxidase assembly factor CtaG
MTSWQWNAGGLSVLALVCIAYAWLYRTQRPKRPGIFAAAVLLLALCFFSPLAVLSEHYLFSAHMSVHVMLLLLVGPLLVMALPHLLPPGWQRAAHALSARPWLGWAAGIGVMWFWHLPGVFNAMMAHGSGAAWMHGAETLSLLVAGVMFSYPLIGASRRMHPLSGVLYLGTACVCCSLLGLMITFAPVGIYHHYLAMHDRFGLNAVISDRWSLSAADDQQAAGLIMWVPCCMIYAAGALLLLRRWFAVKELHDSINSFSKKSTL